MTPVVPKLDRDAVLAWKFAGATAPADVSDLQLQQWFQESIDYGIYADYAQWSKLVRRSGAFQTYYKAVGASALLTGMLALISLECMEDDPDRDTIVGIWKSMIAGPGRKADLPIPAQDIAIFNALRAGMALPLDMELSDE